MKKWILHIMLVGVLGMLAASCSQEADDPTQTADSRKAQVVFTIALDSPSAGSRATWGDDYSPSDIGTDFDNRINPAQFFVKLTLGNATYDVQNIAYWQTNQQNVYEFVGDVNVPIDGTATYPGAKIQVYANMNPEDGIFSTNYETNPGTGVAYIPMWGVQTVDLSLTPGTRTELADPIYLLRAMAKVEVALSAPDFTLTNVSLNKYNTQGNSLPSGAATAANTKALHYDNETGYCFNPNTTGAATNLAFNVTDDHLVFYLPEVENNATDELKMTVTLKKGTETVQLNAPYLYFRTYNAQGSAEGATPFDVVRNHWYQYNITTVNDGIEATLTVKVMDWDTDEESWNYKEQASVENGGKMDWVDPKENENDNDYTVAVEGTNVFVPIATNDNPAVCSFRISTPVGATWHATFETVEGVYGAFMFLDAEGNEVTSVSGKVGELAQLKIITTNTTPTERSSAILRIATRTSDGRTIIVKQLVPDSDDAEYTLVQSIQ